MCTLSVVTREDGFLLGMNRDERLDRGLATPPRRNSIHGVDALYPLDVRGGTWIAVNQLGITLALLNRNEHELGSIPLERDRSRGFIIPELIHLGSLPEIEARTQQLSFKGLPPFCLVGVFPAEKVFGEWNWDGAEMRATAQGWGVRHWFSSGLSDEMAEANRSKVCHSAWEQADAGTAPWLMKLHASHVNGPGPFSICVHRENVQTVSYTEIALTGPAVRLTYFQGSPCVRPESDPGFAESIGADPR
jgi:Transport and Golgi organisation 2